MTSIALMREGRLFLENCLAASGKTGSTPDLEKRHELCDSQACLSDDAPQRAAAEITGVYRNCHLASGIFGVDEAAVTS
jgi:hypothetical protein